MRTIKSEIIGELKQNDQFEDWWESEVIEIPFFDNKKMKITFMDFIPENDTEFIKEADKALKSFLKKSKNDRLLISNLAYENCMEFLNAVEFDDVDKPLRDIKDKNKIWKFIYPQDIYVTRSHDKFEIIYLNLACECEWEQEHGLQLLFKEGEKLTRISEQDGHITESDSYENPIIENNEFKPLSESKSKMEWWKFWK
ncbi:DUF6985 domain-containing protein [Tenacibaculum dicentrarchi]|uniref:DUF6985 domain-containing protein n=1 Tax=Tenacibaculum dicentrarchi TaxID=669041 RepID=UPI00203594CB